MNTCLMHPEQRFDLPEDFSPTQRMQDLIQDLELKSLFDAMAEGDRQIYSCVRFALLAGCESPAHIVYRQQVLQDFLKQRELLKDLRGICKDMLDARRNYWWWSTSSSAEASLSSSVGLMSDLITGLRRLRAALMSELDSFDSPGLQRLASQAQEELGDSYLEELASYLEELRFARGILIGSKLGPGNYGADYSLHRVRSKRPRWFRFSFEKAVVVHERDDAGLADLGRRKARALGPLSAALRQSVNHVLGFVSSLSNELAFYDGCARLHDTLSGKGYSTTFPVPLESASRKLVFSGLVDVSLALAMSAEVVSNDTETDSADIVVITGANQGGKTTFLRSLGQAHVMMGSGIYVAASDFTSAVASTIASHFQREEDEEMKSGKLDAELKRMSAIVDGIGAHALLLCNESFASTNEHEGSEIAAQVTSALVKCNVRVYYVTHMQTFAEGAVDRHGKSALFLEAERLPDGSRSFRMIPGHPADTSHGLDVYYEVFAPEDGQSKGGEVQQWQQN